MTGQWTEQLYAIISTNPLQKKILLCSSFAQGHQWLEQACRIQIDALGCGRPLHTPSEMAIGNTVTCFAGTEITLDNERDTNPVLNEAAQNLQAGYGLLEWPALRRRLDRIDASYAQ